MPGTPEAPVNNADFNLLPRRRDGKKKKKKKNEEPKAREGR